LCRGWGRCRLVAEVLGFEVEAKVVEKVKDMMECIVGGEEPIAWCG
jgi:hypothetical protein